MPWIAECQSVINRTNNRLIQGNYYEVRKSQTIRDFVDVYLPDENSWLVIEPNHAKSIFSKPTWIEPGFNVTYNAT